jgi:hypothetical protein
MMAVMHGFDGHRSSSYTSSHLAALPLCCFMIGHSFRPSSARHLNLGRVVIDSVASYLSLAMAWCQYTAAWRYIGHSLSRFP